MIGLSFVSLLMLIFFCDRVTGVLFTYPKSNKIIETLMPEKAWTSIRECPMRYFDNGFREEVAPLNGRPAVKREFAHMAAVGWTDEVSGNVSWNCGGFLISENVVLTAGHCTLWKGKRPDVVRLGDLNLMENEDDENVQQYSVHEIIVHPNYTSRFHYNDLALVRLNDTVRVHETITPACLWTYPYVKFPLLEACGYGQTSYLGTTTPRLLKIELSPVSIHDCNNYYDQNRKLPNGLRDTQFCAIDFSEQIMDTCLGDSGGPLQIKLLANGRMNPFIIGITSFGRACGDKTPGVYTRISSYVEWIESELKMSFDPQECALRYAKYREFEDDIILDKTKRKFGSWMNFDTTRGHVDVYTNNLNHRVSLIKDSDTEILRRCGGVILTETFVLTLSDCVKEDINGSIKVQVDDTTNIEVKSIFQRQLNGLAPQYDIALVELVKPIEFFDTIHPVCLWPDEKIPDAMELEINSWGPRDYHNVYLDANDRPGFGYISVRAKTFNDTECKEHQLCYGNGKLHLLPETCELDTGGPLERKYFPFTYKFFPYVMGINAYGPDCGFGQPSVAVKVSKAIDWIDSIIFKGAGREQEIESNDNFLPRFKKDLSGLKAYNETHRFELEDCPHIYERYRRKSGQTFNYDDMPIYQHVVFIGNANFYQPCHGVLITNQHVLAAYSCLYNPRNHPFEFTPELIEIIPEIRGIAEVKHHEKRTTLIKMNATINLSFDTLPACLWLEKDATPFELTILRPGYDETESSYIPVRPYQNNICKQLRNDTEKTQALLTKENYGCLSFIYGKSSCDFEDNRVIVQAIRNISETIVPFIVGIIDTNADCQENKPIIYSRIAYDIDWIRKNLY